MMKKVGLGLLALAFAAGTLFFIWKGNFAEHSLAGSWTIEVKNLNDEIVTTLLVEFTEEPAVSCIGLDFKAVQVLDYETIDATFFPVNDPIVYRLSDGEISIGRANVCDNYFFLGGELKRGQATGGYLFTTIGESKQLGTFSMIRD